MLSQLHILVTGGAGFIGSHIVESLLAKGVASVKVIDNLSTGRKERLNGLLSQYKNLEFIYGDISNLEILRKSIIGCNAVCHQAAIHSLPDSFDDPLQCHRVNEIGFFNILELAKQQGIKRIVYASCSSVYGNIEKQPLREYYIGTPLSPLGASKIVNETHAKIFHECYGLECIGLRYFNVFGHGQDANSLNTSVVSKFVHLLKQGISPTILGDGYQTRDFVHVMNVVYANELALTTLNEKAFGEVFNVGTNEEYSLLELVKKINIYIGKKIKPWYANKRKRDVKRSLADISKASNILGYQVQCHFDDGLYSLLLT